jgi:disulfide bond formation protein DsbB
MKKLSLSTLQLILFTITLVVLGMSYYLQYGKGFEPCPLCLMQRICIIFILAFSVINLYRKPARGQSFAAPLGIFALLGLFFAFRQIWLMSLPDNEVPACLPGLSVLIHYFPWQDTVRALVWGSGDCTEIRWTFLGLSLPVWSTLYFFCIGLLSSVIYYKQRQKSDS